uniref:Ig-like domain-containing protein n=1 Tax=Cyprinus carpio TaxID=7962 RepID=A0A8C1RGG4_CYPCA
MLLLQPLIGLLLISLAHGDCPILISPVDVVVEYGDSFSANCSSTDETIQFGLSWDGYDETMKKTEDDIFVDVTNWEMNLTCYMYSNKTKCSQGLPVTIYKTPDSVSISIVNHRGPMIEGQQYELQCDIYNVAPVQELTVKWYKGQTLLNQTTFTEDNKSPVNETATLQIRPDRTDDGAQYRCEAELDLGEDGPQYPTESLQPLSAELHYTPKPSSSTETIIKNDEVTRTCTVKANPAPTYTSHSEHLKEEISSSVLQSPTLSPGNYTCTATNSLGSDSKVFIIESKESRCPIQLVPWRAVVRYGDSVAVNCSATVPHKGLGWEASEGGVPMTKDKKMITWRVSHLTEWDIQPYCYINHEKQCQVELPVTIYKTPDSVSISIVNHSGPMIEGQQYELQCDVQDVAPVQNLTVKWYKGQTLLNQTTFTEVLLHKP